MTTSEGDATLTASDRSAEPPLPAIDLVAGVKIDRYVVERRLGAGGMGVVYAARDTELGREVALKIVRPRAGVDAMQSRLRREAKAMARLSHRNVVPVFDIGTHDGQLFIAMELVAGDTLRSWVTRPRPWRDAVQLFVKAGRGLEAAHAAGLVHRDFKPDNVVIGHGDEPRITDFGLARELGEGDGPPSTPPSEGGELSQVTATGSLAGTPAYMAPEQLLGRHSGPAADQFSFCVSLYEVLYGARPFRPVTARPEAQVSEIRAGRIARPTAARGVPGWIHAALVRGLAFEPARRWPSMAALVDALDGKRRARRRRVAAVVAGLALAAGGGLGATAVLRDRDRTPPASCLDLALKGND
ncbi:MAG TPA: serine/threonine-protein kinase, partial [Kofleriaceae bacterium]|nr:serine/threonine-protein kinase [Kofleriaceae bacterium]